MFNHKLPTDFPMQTLRKKTSPCKYKNEPGRFLGEGVSFRAKLIGVLEVPEARGDRMCQEALADLKMAIRAAGEHKQRIQVHVAIDGLRLRDDKTGDSLYHHPVHKISFIAQDMTDSRAFGYIFGSPDTGHRFFGIKTDKAASQVVIAMRDLFQVVFELKKKEVELAKQQLEGKAVVSSLVRHAAIAEPKVKSIPSVGLGESPQPKVEAEGGVAELVDLEQELSSLRRGLTQVEGLTPAGDPFGDSFLAPSGHTAKGLLPPPPSGSSTRGRNTPSSRVFSPNKSSLPFDLAAVAADFEPQPASLVDHTHTDNSVQAGPSTSLSYDVFTELDPLGTGRSKPYVDKKLFFQELKNPPKKVLKDLVPSTSTTTHTQSLLSDILPESTHSKSEQYGPTTTMTSLSRHSGGTVSIAKPSYGGNFFSADPFAETDPFDNTDPFSDSFKDDPFTTMAEFPKSILRAEDFKSKLSREMSLDKDKDSLSLSDSGSGIVVKSVFNGPLQVSLPPEPVPKSPRLQRQNTDTSSIRQRPQPSSKLSAENASPPPPLPPKKISEVTLPRPPPRPPHDHDDDSGDVGPPLPRPARKKEPMADRSTKPRLSSIATNSSEEEAYLTPAPPPVPSPKRFDITLSQLLVCTMPELAARLRVPEATLSSMTLPQLTEYLRSYLAADNDKKHIHVDPVKKPDAVFPKPYAATAPPIPSIPHLEKLRTTPPISDFRPQFEDNFTPPPHSADTFVANFEDFDKKASSSYDRYAAFREIQEQELKSKSILDPIDSPTKEELRQDSEETELATINNLISNNNKEKEENKEMSKSPLKSLDELTLDSFNMFQNSVSPKPTQPIDAKIEDIKSVMKTLQIEKNVGRRSVSPRDPRENNIGDKDDASDRYAALREITITEPPQDEFESLPSEAPKERKRSDEKSDGFDNSDFFDCIDNSSLSFSHVEDAFRKSPSVKDKEEMKVVEEKKEIVIEPLREVREAPPARMSTGSVSDVASGSSPDTKDRRVAQGGGGRGARVAAGRWAVLGSGAGVSPWSSDSRESEPRPRRRRPHHEPAHAHTRGGTVQTSSSSRDVSPWDEEPPPPPVARLQRPPAHAHRDRDSRHGSSGSRECLDSGSGREKDKRDKRDSRDREIRDGRDSGRERRDSGSGRDRRDSKERDHREHRDRRDRRSRDRERENESWDRDRSYSREREYRDSRSRERKDYRDRHRKPRDCYGEEDYSDGCRSGRSSPRERWPDQRWRRDERNYGSLGWRESRRRNEVRPSEEANDRRYGTTLNWPSRRSGSRRESDRDRDSRDRSDRSELRDRSDRSELRDRTDRDARDRTDRDIRDRTDRDTRDRDPRRRSRREEREPRRPRADYRFSNDFTAREARSPPSLPHPAHPAHSPHASPFDNQLAETPTVNKKRAPYTSLEGTRFTFDPEDATASPLSASSARRDGDSASAASGAGARFRFDSDSVSPRSMFEDDFTTISTPRGRTASIAEEDESDVPPLRKPQNSQLNQHRDIKKSESVNIFTRESDPFEGDAFFACTGSDRAARRDNWPGDFQGFDNA